MVYRGVDDETWTSVTIVIKQTSCMLQIVYFNQSMQQAIIGYTKQKDKMKNVLSHAVPAACTEVGRCM